MQTYPPLSEDIKLLHFAYDLQRKQSRETNCVNTYLFNLCIFIQHFLHDCSTVYISKFLDIILSPLVQEIQSFIKDTPQFLQIINDIEFLFTMDASCLYTSIPHDGALKASKEFLDKRNNKVFLRLPYSNLLNLCLK